MIELFQDQLSTLRGDGFVLLPPLPRDLVSELAQDFSVALSALLSRVDPRDYCEFPGHALTSVPQSPAFLNAATLAPQRAIALCLEAIGHWETLCLCCVACNVNLPNSGEQRLHADNGQLWPNLTVIPPPHLIGINIPLVDISNENGATEIWPGTHKRPEIVAGLSQFVPDEVASSVSEIHPPVRLVAPAGAVIVRDGRTWHRGMPNYSSEPRPMLSILFAAPFVDAGMPELGLSASAIDLFRNSDVELKGDFLKEPDEIVFWKN